MGTAALRETTIEDILKHKHLPYSDIRFLAENPESIDELPFEHIESLLSHLRGRRRAIVDRIRKEHMCRLSRSKDLLECTKVVKSGALRVLTEKRALHLKSQRHAEHMREIDRQMNLIENCVPWVRVQKKTP